MELSQKLKELRKKQGLTQLELAERLFVSRQAISGWEAGTSRPSTENLQSLSRLFNIPLETLLDDSAEAEPAAAQEKLPAEEQAKEEDKGQGKARRYKAIWIRANYSPENASLDFGLVDSNEKFHYDRVNRGTGRKYQSEVYTCRKDEAGRKLDKAAMLVCSKALGHNRISVVADNYIRGL